MSSCRIPSLALRCSLRALSQPANLCRPVANQRFYAVQAAGAPRFQVFNRRTKWLQKERAGMNAEESRETDYLKDEVAIRLSERLLVSIHG
jgi:NADH dehydrogenase [ubiquinone] 1 alpha subcomplex assembly factor 5